MVINLGPRFVFFEKVGAPKLCIHFGKGESSWMRKCKRAKQHCDFELAISIHGDLWFRSAFNVLPLLQQNRFQKLQFVTCNLSSGRESRETKSFRASWTELVTRTEPDPCLGQMVRTNYDHLRDTPAVFC